MPQMLKFDRQGRRQSGLAKKLLLVIVAVFMLAMLLGAGAVWALRKSYDQEDGEREVPKTAIKKAEKHAQIPQYIRLEPFTVKLQPDEAGQEQYLQVVPELKALDLPAGEKIKAYMPELRHEMLSHLSGKKPAELSTPQGIENLAVELRNRINQPLGDPGRPRPSGDRPGPDDPVQAVLFSSFIIQ